MFHNLLRPRLQSFFFKRMTSLTEYFDRYGTDIVSWSHIRTRCRPCHLTDVLEHALTIDAQVVYLNHPDMARPNEFAGLIRLLENTNIWAINLGEIEFSPAQCHALTVALHRSQVAFMFVDAVFVGKDQIWIWKKIIRDRRRETQDAPWLLSDNPAQNLVIAKCRNMWWSPMSLGRNKTKQRQMRAADLISRREAGDDRRDSVGDERRDSVGDERRD